MAKYTLEQIDYLREKASITYEEALETLERFDGDLARCLVDLERRGRIKPPRKPAGAGSHYRYEFRYDQNAKGYDRGCNREHDRAYGQQPRGKAFVLDHESVKQALFSHIVVRKSDKVVADLPVVFLIFAVFMAPHLMFSALLLIFLLGYRVKWERKQEKPDRANDIFAFVDKTAEHIRRTADSFARAVKNEVCPPAFSRDEAGEPAEPTQAPQEEYGAEEGDQPNEFTVE
ncbi:MAG: hypothetical protein FWE77_04820 [Clostridia bacterium]|nr:hypothetical protein [Clostridia bacterium]